MRTILRSSAIFLLAAHVLVATSAPSGAATRAITVTPNTNLAPTQTVLVTGSGFSPNTPMSVGQCLDEGPTGGNCFLGLENFTSSSDGTFSISLLVRAQPDVDVDCRGPQACNVTAFEDEDPLGTAVAVPLTFGFQPDAQIVRLSDGVITGDDVYSSGTNFKGQSRLRSLTQGASWFYALRSENDGITDDDIVLTGDAGGPGITVRYFLGYYDVTAYVTGGGFTWTDLGPGAAFKLAVDFRASSTVPVGSTRTVVVTFTSKSDPSRLDRVKLGVTVSAP